MAEYKFDDVHKVEAAIVHCLDPRFQKAHRAFIEQELGIRHYDSYVLPGGAKNLLEEEFGKKLFEKINDVSFKLHGACRIILIIHRDCGAYGGTKAFASTHDEKHRQESDLRLAREMFCLHLPEITTETYSLTINDGQCKFEKVEH